MMIDIGTTRDNIWLLRRPCGNVMIDGGRPGTLPSVVRRMARNGLAPRDIACIFLTHANAGTSGLLEEFLEISPHTAVICSPLSWAVLRRGGSSNGEHGPDCDARRLKKESFPAVSERHEDRFIFLDRDGICEAERMLDGRILATPGFSDDSVSVMFDRDMFAGNAAAGAPRKSRLPITVSDPEALEESWERITEAWPLSIYPKTGRPFPADDLVRYREDIGKLHR